MTEDYKVDPRTIHVDQRKKDVRRDAWDRDYMGIIIKRLIRKVINKYQMRHQFLCLHFFMSVY